MKHKDRLKQFFRRFFSSRTYRVCAIDNVAEHLCRKITEIIPATKPNQTWPSFWGYNCDAVHARSKIDLIPAIKLYEFEDVEVAGWTDFIFYKNKAIIPSMIDIKNDVFVAELERRARVNIERSEVALWTKFRSIKVHNAISLLGQSSCNYAHFLTEVLPRLVHAAKFPHLDDYSLLVDTDCHPNIYSAIVTTGHAPRNIIYVKPWQRVRVQRLAYITPPSYTRPDNRRYFEQGVMAPPGTNTYFSEQSLDEVRNTVGLAAIRYLFPEDKSSIGRNSRTPAELSKSKALRRSKYQKDASLSEKVDGNANKEERKTSRRRLFFVREQDAHNGRTIANMQEVLKLLKKYRFTDVSMQRLSFEDQVSLMRGCEIIVSPIGADLGNAVFAPKGTKIVVLSPNYKNADFSYFSNLLTALGHRVAFVLGVQIPIHGKSIYRRPYKVDIRGLEDALKDFFLADRALC